MTARGLGSIIGHERKPHGLTETHKDQLNAALLAFLKP